MFAVSHVHRFMKTASENELQLLKRVTDNIAGKQPVMDCIFDSIRVVCGAETHVPHRIRDELLMITKGEPRLLVSLECINTC